MNRKEFRQISEKAFHKWQSNNATLRAAALAFFTIMPLPSVLLILASLSALVYGQPQALQRLIDQISIVVGPAVAGMAEQLLLGGENSFTSTPSSAINIVFAIVGAIGAFAVLQDTLNIIWDVQLPKKRSIKTRFQERIIPFLLVSGTGAIVVAWTSLSTLFSSALSVYLQPLIGNSAAIILGATQIILSFGLSVLLFSFIYTQVPDAPVAWGDVWLASIITSFIVTALNYLFGIYLRAFPVTTISGAAGSLIILLLWLFIMDQFILFGAQFSNVYAENLGSCAKKRTLEVDKPNKKKSLAEIMKIMRNRVSKLIHNKQSGHSD